jgi:hypothetical protein
MRSGPSFIIPDMMAFDSQRRNSQASAPGGRTKRTSNKENKIPKLAGGAARGAKQSSVTSNFEPRQQVSRKGLLSASAVSAVPDAVAQEHGPSSAIVQGLLETVGASHDPISPTYEEAAQRMAHHRWRTDMLAQRQQSPLHTELSKATFKRSSTLTDPIKVPQF